MNETTNLNSELLSADARGRKHIPVAVFAVIVVHVILFLILLVAAGCRAKARAKLLPPPAAELPEMLAQSSPPPPSTPVVAAPVLTTPVLAVEPAPQKTQPVARKSVPRTAALHATSPTPTISTTARNARIYTVKNGETLEKIAKMHRTSVEAIKTENNLKNHVLRPGQQLRVSTQPPKPSKDV